MRNLDLEESKLVAGGRQEVIVPGRRMGPSNPLFAAFLNDIGAYSNIHSSLVAAENGRPGDARQSDSSEMEEVLVEAEKILADNLKVDLTKCGIPLDYLLNPPDKWESSRVWAECFKTLTPEDRKNLADASKDLSKVIKTSNLATAVTGNWIKQCITAIESGNGGWFGQNYFDTLQSGKLSAVIKLGISIITRR
jgi:hypothetical protein